MNRLARAIALSIAVASIPASLRADDVARDGGPVAVRIEKLGAAVRSVSFGGDAIVAAAGERLVSWDARTGLERGRVGRAHAGGVRHVEVSPSGDKVASGGSDGLKLWTLDLEPLPSFETGPVATFAFSRAGDRIAVAGSGVVRVYTLDGKLVRQLGSHSTAIGRWLWGDARALAFSPSGDELAALNAYEIRIWSIRDGSIVRNMRGDAGVAWTSAGIATGGRPAAWIYRDDGSVLRKLYFDSKKEAVVVALAVSGDRIAAAGFDDEIRVWSLATGLLERQLVGHRHRIEALAFTASGDLVSASADSTVRVWKIGAPPTSGLATRIGGP